MGKYIKIVIWKRELIILKLINNNLKSIKIKVEAHKEADRKTSFCKLTKISIQDKCP